MSGGGAKVKGISELMQENTGIPVETVNPLKNVELNPRQFDPEVLKDQAPFFGVAVGLATRRFGDR